ncbi:MAG: hypothetical protein JNL71_13660 [Rhodospirillales bacterium]|nr:hypothetical protein [Rhodospirillales bacterium]
MAKDRRSLLKIGGAAAVAALVPASAMALRVEELDVPRQRLLLAACETRSTHQRVLADLIREMEAGGADAGEARAKAAASSCPFCGCNLAALDLPADGDAPKF